MNTDYIDELEKSLVDDEADVTGEEEEGGVTTAEASASGVGSDAPQARRVTPDSDGGPEGDIEEQEEARELDVPEGMDEPEARAAPEIGGPSPAAEARALGAQAPAEARKPDKPRSARPGSHPGTPGKAAIDKQQDRWKDKKFGPFRIRKCIGKGSMGIVFLAHDPQLDRDLALKVLRSDIKGTDAQRRVDLFIREGRAAATLNHPNIVEIYSAGEIVGWRYVTMEYLEGGSVRDLVEKAGPRDPASAALIFADAASGLAEAHEAGIIHRDIKPSNLMLNRRGRCKLADFGLVKLDESTEEENYDRNIVGTPHFVAPEVIRRQGAVPTTDIYSLGCSFYFVLTGQCPFDATTRPDLFKKHLTQAAPDIRKLMPSCPDVVAELIRVSLEKNPGNRPNAMTFANTLRLYAAQASIGPSPLSGAAVSSVGGGSIIVSSPGMQGSGSAMGAGSEVSARRGPWAAIAAGAAVTAALALAVIALGPWNQGRSGSQTNPSVESGVPLAEVVPVQARAMAAWTAANTEGRGKGLDEPLKQGQLLLAEAQAFFDAKDHGRARDKYLELEQAAAKVQDGIKARAARIADLLKNAQSLDNPEKGRQAIKLLAELLAIDPGHTEAVALKQKITNYYIKKPGDLFTNTLGMRLAYVPAGRFTMGSPASELHHDEDERPHVVTLTKPLYMGATEVTQAQWQSVMGKNYVSPDGVHPNDQTGDRWRGDDLPEDGVSWNEAVEFCKRLSAKTGQSYRLPSEAEWEYACRAGATTPFHPGATLTSRDANIDGGEPYGDALASDWRERTIPVASFQPNAWGLYDMHGNLAEWCQDWYAPGYAVGEVTNPTGPSTPPDPNTATRVTRGGSWKHPAHIARSANRVNVFPQIKANYIGFRVVMEVPAEEAAPNP
jgi:formylglycine-generating enzyme required for sulfatase activity